MSLPSPIRSPIFAAIAWLSLLALAATGCRSVHPDSAQPISLIAFGSCAEQTRPQPFWDPILALQPDLFIFCGDNIYGDSEDMQILATAYQQLGDQPGYQALQEQCPVLATWDDHDYGVNDGGKGFAAKAESKNLFLNFFGEPTHSPRRSREGIYHSVVLGPPGKRVQIILLDTRWFRDNLVPDDTPDSSEDGKWVANPDSNTTILGTQQWAWLEQELKRPAELRLLVSSIQVVAKDHHWERWMNFPHERQRLFDLITSSQASGVVILSGDRHRGEISRMDQTIGYPLYDVTASGLNMSWANGPPEKNEYRVGEMHGTSNFGVIQIDWAGDNPAVDLQLLSDKGTLLESVTLRLNQLQAP